jgi:hypothetical protein
MVVNYDNFLLATDLADTYVTELPDGRALLRRHQVHHEIVAAMS